MALPQNQHFKNQLQLQQQQSDPFRDFYNFDGQTSLPVANFNCPDQSHHPPYIPPYNFVGLDCGLEPKQKRVKEQDFLENNSSQLSYVDFLQPRSVSTGLGLSLDNGRLASSGDSPILSIVGDEIERELQRQDAEIERFIKVQSDKLRQAVLEKLQANQLQTILQVENKFVRKLREKEAEMDIINKKNMELEKQIEQLAMEAGAWQQRAKNSEIMINTLNFNLQQAYVQGRNDREGCGDSEIDDTASCCNGRAIDFHLLCQNNNDMKELMTCKVCRVNEVRMLLLPCKHLCLCKECESKLTLCPLCQSSKYIGIEVFM